MSGKTDIAQGRCRIFCQIVPEKQQINLLLQMKFTGAGSVLGANAGCVCGDLKA